jgi:hypothetical protein
VTESLSNQSPVRAFIVRAGREPLVHFLLIGAVLFVGILAARSLQKPVVRIDAQELGQLAGYWSTQMQRDPTNEELQGIIHERVDEEVLAREALRLGLDKDDMIVRRRLAQKMTFASEDTANLPEPDEAALRAFFEKTKADYQAPPRVTFRHQFFNSDRGKDQALERAKAALGKVGAGQGDPLGEPFLLPLSYSDASLIDLNKDYGQDFAGVLLTAPLNQWSGPIASAYGYHLIKVDSRISAKTPTLDEVRSDVLAAYQEQARKARNAAFLDGLRKKYRVEISGIPQTVLTQP